MSKFQEFLSSQANQPKTGRDIEGSFYCQHCDVEVDDAEYFPLEHVLKWKCPDGHVSYIEEFKL